MAPDGIGQSGLHWTSLVRTSELLVELILCPVEVGRCDVHWVELPAVREDSRVLNEDLGHVLPVADGARLCSLLGRKGTLKEALHERQWRLKGEIITESILQALFELKFGVVEVRIARLESRVEKGCISDLCHLYVCVIRHLVA